MSDPDPALLELLAAAGYDLEPRGDGWAALHRTTGLAIGGATPAETARWGLEWERRAAELESHAREAAERAEQIAAALARLGDERQ